MSKPHSAVERICSFVLVLLVALAIVPGSPLQPLAVYAAVDEYVLANDGWTLSGGAKTAYPLVIPSTATDVRITGSYTSTNFAVLESNIVVVDTGFVGDITIDNLNVQVSTNNTGGTLTQGCAFLVRGDMSANAATNQQTQTNVTKVQLHMVGTSTLQSSGYHAGLSVWKGAEVTLNGPGKVIARCYNPTNGDPETTSPHTSLGDAAGVGSSNIAGSGGDIFIKGGEVVGVAGYHGAGIGGAHLDPGYSGTILILGGKIRSWGGAHGAGIGGGCIAGTPGGTGTIVVLPDQISSVEINSDSAGGYAKVGAMTTTMYLGDGYTAKVKTEDSTLNANMYINMANYPNVSAVLTRFGISSSQVDYTKVYLGNTGTTGEVEFKATLPQAVVFFSDAKTASTPPLDYLAVNDTVTANGKVVTLPKPVFKLTVVSISPSTLTPLTYGYNPVPSSHTINVTLRNDGNTSIKDLAAVMENAATAPFEIVTPLSSAILAVNATATVVIRPKLGLNAGTHNSNLTVSGKGESGSGVAIIDVAMADQTIEMPQLTVNKATSGSNGGFVIASPDADLVLTNYYNYTTAILTTNSGANNSIVSWKYAVTKSTANPGTWTDMGIAATTTANFGSNPYDDDDYYIHWSVENSNYTDTTGYIGPYKLDRTPPKVTAMTTPITTAGPDDFTVEIQFSEDIPATMLTAAGLTVTNATVKGIARKGSTLDTFIVTLGANPSTPSNSTITVQVNQNAVNDKAQNDNLSSAASGISGGGISILFNKDKPTSSYSFNAGAQFYTNQSSISITLVSNGVSDKKLYQAGTTTEVSGAYATQFITVQKTDAPTGPVTYTATYAANANGGVYTITPTGGFNHGDYTVSIATNKVQNIEANTLDASSRSFSVRIPVLSISGNAIQVTPNNLPYTGGKVTVQINGQYLQYLTPGQLQIELPMSLGGTRVNPSISGDGLTATYQVTLPLNAANTPENYLFTTYLNANASGTDTAVVQAATPSFGVKDGIVAAPSRCNYRGTSVDLTVTGINLHNYTGLRISVKKDGTEVRSIPATTIAHGAVTIMKAYTIPVNSDPAGHVYTFELYDGTTALGKTATTNQGAATPGISGFTVSDKATVQGGSALTLDDAGGLVYFTIEGLHLHNFPLMTIDGIPMAGSITLSGPANDNDKGTATAMIPPNRTLKNQVYTYTLKSAGSERSVTITVKKPEFGPRFVTAIPDRLSATGGNSTFTIEGINMDIAPLELVNKENPSERYTVATPGSQVRIASTSLGFSGHGGGLRNDIYEYEVYFAGGATGLTATVEVGDSAPNLTGIDANPDYFSSVKDTLNGKGQSVITVHGNYLFNFKSLQIHDKIYDRMYTVSNIGKDMEASYNVTVPSAVGIYEYDLYCEGQKTQYTAIIHVGVALGTSGVPTVPTNENPKTDKQWNRRGGGAKGGGFTGRRYVPFDVLRYQSEVAARENPENPSVTLLNIGNVVQWHFNLAMTGARTGAGWTAVREGKGVITLHFDTSDRNDETVLEGRLSVRVDMPLPDMYPGVFLDELETGETRQLFKNRFDNKNLIVVCLDQNGSYGTRAEVAVNADLTDFNTENLYFYRYDRETGQYERMRNTGYFIDTADFLHFFSENGGDIIVTDKPLIQGEKVSETGTLPTHVE